ncbi:hypothetical protein MKX53_02250 [Psychrobacillus sp. FSL K6-4615]|uniref:hypothetical protein n=1 Tax=Psychrobacillus sp. FSL K6-4615 TaxID=2921551 RepID=UPI0030F6EEDD
MGTTRAESTAGAYVFVVTRRLKPCHGDQQIVGNKGIATRRGSLSLCSPQVAEISSIIHS